MKELYEEPTVEVLYLQPSGSILTASNDSIPIQEFDPGFIGY